MDEGLRFSSVRTLTPQEIQKTRISPRDDPGERKWQVTLAFWPGKLTRGVCTVCHINKELDMTREIEHTILPRIYNSIFVSKIQFEKKKLQSSELREMFFFSNENREYVFLVENYRKKKFFVSCK